MIAPLPVLLEFSWPIVTTYLTSSYLISTCNRYSVTSKQPRLSRRPGCQAPCRRPIPPSPRSCRCFPCVMSWPAVFAAYSFGLRKPTGLPAAALIRAMSPAHSGATALVPPTDRLRSARREHAIVARDRRRVACDIGHAAVGQRRFAAADPRDAQAFLPCRQRKHGAHAATRPRRPGRRRSTPLRC